MNRPAVNPTPAVLLAALTLLFVVTWQWDAAANGLAASHLQSERRPRLAMKPSRAPFVAEPFDAAGPLASSHGTEPAVAIAISAARAGFGHIAPSERPVSAAKLLTSLRPPLLPAATPMAEATGRLGPAGRIAAACLINAPMN